MRADDIAFGGPDPYSLKITKRTQLTPLRSQQDKNRNDNITSGSYVQTNDSDEESPKQKHQKQRSAFSIEKLKLESQEFFESESFKKPMGMTNAQWNKLQAVRNFNKQKYEVVWKKHDHCSGNSPLSVRLGTKQGNSKKSSLSKLEI